MWQHLKSHTVLAKAKVNIQVQVMLLQFCLQMKIQFILRNSYINLRRNHTSHLIAVTPYSPSPQFVIFSEYYERKTQQQCTLREM